MSRKKDNTLDFPQANPYQGSSGRAELTFEMHGEDRIMELVEREPLGLLPKMIQVPFALLKEAVSQILTVEAAEAAYKAGARMDDQGKFDRRSLPVGLQRKMQVADILHEDAENELTSAHADSIVEAEKERAKL